MAEITDLGTKNIKEQIRVYNLELNSPINGKKSIILRKEKLVLMDNAILSQTQVAPVIKNYSSLSNETMVVFDPILGHNVTISKIAIIEAIQKMES
jgi:hypothetical protein